MKNHRIIAKTWFRIGGIALVLGLLLGVVSLLPGAVSSSPLAQDEVLNLGCDDEVTKVIVAEDYGEADDPYTYLSSIKTS